MIFLIHINEFNYQDLFFNNDFQDIFIPCLEKNFINVNKLNNSLMILSNSNSLQNQFIYISDEVKNKNEVNKLTSKYNFIIINDNILDEVNF